MVSKAYMKDILGSNWGHSIFIFNQSGPHAKILEFSAIIATQVPLNFQRNFL